MNEDLDLATRQVEQNYVRPSWMAKYWGVTIDTVRRDIKKGALPARRLPGGQLMIRKEDAINYGRPQQ